MMRTSNHCTDYLPEVQFPRERPEQRRVPLATGAEVARPAMALYPNPASTEAYLKWPVEEKGSLIQVMDAQGRIPLEHQLYCHEQHNEEQMRRRGHERRDAPETARGRRVPEAGDPAGGESLQIAPNPSAGQTVLSVGTPPQKGRLAIHDASGRVVLQRGWPAGGRSYILEAGALAPGAYVVRVASSASATMGSAGSAARDPAGGYVGRLVVLP